MGYEVLYRGIQPCGWYVPCTERIRYEAVRQAARQRGSSSCCTEGDYEIPPVPYHGTASSSKPPSCSLSARPQEVSQETRRPEQPQPQPRPNHNHNRYSVQPPEQQLGCPLMPAGDPITDPLDDPLRSAVPLPDSGFPDPGWYRGGQLKTRTRTRTSRMIL